MIKVCRPQGLKNKSHLIIIFWSVHELFNRPWYLPETMLFVLFQGSFRSDNNTLSRHFSNSRRKIKIQWTDDARQAFNDAKDALQKRTKLYTLIQT